MGKIRKYLPAKLISGFIFQNKSSLIQAESILKRYFANIDFESPVLDFIYTDYYEKEFGCNLKRKFISFKRLVDPADLYKIKILTNKIESKLLDHKTASRLINIDPGYLDFAKLVLASTKDYYHRIYLNKGIFAEITLSYQGKTFQPLEWTYPDYKTKEYIDIFNQIRIIYEQQIKNH